MASTLKTRPSVRPGPGTSLDSGTTGPSPSGDWPHHQMAASYSNTGPLCHDKHSITRDAPETLGPTRLAHRRRGGALDAHCHRPGRRAVAAAAATATTTSRGCWRRWIRCCWSSCLSAGQSYVIVRAQNAGAVGIVSWLITALGGTLGRTLPILTARAARLPNAAVLTLAASPLVKRIALDRLTLGFNERTSATVGADVVRQQLGYDGAGIGVAVIDSGVTNWHNDLADPAAPTTQRVDQFVDFVGGQSQRYDDYGHGTHVAGIIAGNGADSNGARTGIAPKARLVVLKVLDERRSRTHQRRHCGDRLRRRSQERVQHPRHQHVDRRGRLRVLQHRSPHAGRQARGRGRPRGGRGRRQSRPQRRGRGPARGDLGAGECAVGDHRGRRRATWARPAARTTPSRPSAPAVRPPTITPRSPISWRQAWGSTPSAVRAARCTTGGRNTCSREPRPRRTCRISV